MAELETVRRQAEAWGLCLGDEVLKALLGYAIQLANYREANVIGVRDLSQLLLEHILDSLSCLLYEPLWRAKELVDVGAGGGLPGIPLKEVRSEMGLTLVEATGKKARFLEKVVEEESLKGTEIVNARAEVVGRDPTHREI